VTSFIKQAYDAYFGMKLGDLDKTWAPHMVCKSCTKYLRHWTKGKKKCLNFGIPMVWREPRNHDSDCYFCAIEVTGINRKNAPALGTLIWNQPTIQYLIRMKFLCLFFQNFQTLVKMSHLVRKNLKMKSCLIVTMLLHNRFPRKN